VYTLFWATLYSSYADNAGAYRPIELLCISYTLITFRSMLQIIKFVLFLTKYEKITCSYQTLLRHILLYKRSLHDIPEDQNIIKTDQKGG